MSNLPQNPPLNLDEAELERFARLGRLWWDEKGPMRVLHAMNTARVPYLRDVVCAAFEREHMRTHWLEGLDVLDVGCGGGILSEPLTRLGGKVLGIDPAQKNIPIAQEHAAKMGLDIEYRGVSAEVLVQEGRTFDVVCALEVIEHVPDPKAFVQTLKALLKPNGVLVMSTINRNPLAGFVAIFGAEYVARLLPKGTHRYDWFVTPDEMQKYVEDAGLVWLGAEGMVPSPFALSWKWNRSAITAVNYIASAQNKPPKLV